MSFIEFTIVFTIPNHIFWALKRLYGRLYSLRKGPVTPANHSAVSTFTQSVRMESHVQDAQIETVSAIYEAPMGAWTYNGQTSVVYGLKYA